MKYAEITEHVPFLLRPQILKHYLICCLILNLLTFCKVKNRLLNKTINHMGTIFPVLVTFIFYWCITSVIYNSLCFLLSIVIPSTLLYPS
jgi:hypothetical protein